MVNNIKWRCIYGRSSEDKHSIKNSIQSTMKLKSFMQRLPLALFKKNMSILRLYVLIWPRNDIDG